MNYLLSQPRSGNTFLRYCIEFITNRPTKGCFGTQELGLYEKIDGISIDKNNEFILQKEHSVSNIKLENNDKIILLVRNPFDVVSTTLLRRNHNERNENLIKIILENYLNLLKFYDSWGGDKLIIYYEDFMNNTIDVIREVLIFLNELNNDKLNDFELNLDYHRKKTYDHYDKYATRITKNDKNIIDKIDKKLLPVIDELIKKDNYIYQTYISKYESINNRN